MLGPGLDVVTGDQPGRLIIRDRPFTPDLFPDWRVRRRQRLGAELADKGCVGARKVSPLAVPPTQVQVAVAVPRCGQRPPPRIQLLKQRLQLMVDRVVLAHCVNVCER